MVKPCFRLTKKKHKNKNINKMFDKNLNVNLFEIRVKGLKEPINYK